MTSTILPGAEPWSHVGDGDRGAVVLHGFTGNPSSMRGVAEALAAKNFHVELPRLPGHGTIVDDMLPTRWSDWAAEAEAAHQRLAGRASRIVVVGLSMGGALTLRLGADHPEIDGLVCINPVTQPQTPVIVDMLRGLADGGTAVLPGIGSDIADPDATESAYEGTPIEALLSMLLDGIEPLSHEYAGMRIPLLLMNSPQDHVVEPVHAEFLADHYGGPLHRITLERSYHVATQDYDKELIVEATADFATRGRRRPMISVLASIPSPSSGELKLGPLSIHAYGLMIALGVIAAVWLLGRRLEASGVGTREDASVIAVWAVFAGVIGSRIYHVVTDWQLFEHDLARIPQIWRGGLGIPGGILFGSVAGMWAFKRRGIAPVVGLSAGAPTLPLAQAIGRWGNWWNQELFGKPTDLPWGLKLSPGKVPVGYPADTTFHPTFLYESLWNFALCGFLLWIDRRYRLRPGRIFLVYLVGYGSGRFWVESLRIDPAHEFAGLRVNQWVALAMALAAAALLIVDWQRHRNAPVAHRERPVASTVVSERISPEVVVKVARLARLDLTAHEIERTTDQLADMLDHFADIDALQLDDVEPMNQPYPLDNVFRDDVINPGLDRDEVLAVAPQAEDGRFRVPPIIGLEA